MTYRDKTQVLDEVTLDRALTRIAHEIVEQAQGVDEVALVGIKTRGETLAERIAQKIEGRSQHEARGGCAAPGGEGARGEGGLT